MGGPVVQRRGRGKARATMELIEACIEMTEDDAQRKAFVTLQARAALIGAKLYPISTGGYLLLRWNLTRELDTLAEVEALLAQMGPPRVSS